MKAVWTWNQDTPLFQWKLTIKTYYIIYHSVCARSYCYNNYYHGSYHCSLRFIPAVAKSLCCYAVLQVIDIFVRNWENLNLMMTIHSFNQSFMSRIWSRVWNLMRGYFLAVFLSCRHPRPLQPSAGSPSMWWTCSVTQETRGPRSTSPRQSYTVRHTLQDKIKYW